MISPGEHKTDTIVLIVDDVPENLAVLHDALDELGFTVLVANHGEAALEVTGQVKPDVILLDAMMPGMDGFEVCRRLKINLDTRHIPVIFMTGLAEAEHVVTAFKVGATDYVTKPIRAIEVLARINAHIDSSRMMFQARSALDAFGQAAIAINLQSGKVLWQTPLAKRLLQSYFPNHSGTGAAPEEILAWAGQALGSAHVTGIQPLCVIRAQGRLFFSFSSPQQGEEWLVVLREESETANIQTLMSIFTLTQRESEVLYWLTKGKTSRDIGDILGSSPRTINKHLEHIYAKLGVENRTAAVSWVTNKLRQVKQG